MHIDIKTENRKNDNEYIYVLFVLNKVYNILSTAIKPKALRSRIWCCVTLGWLKVVSKF